MKAIVYTRVSTKEQVDEGNSLATQERQCRAFALQHDYEIVKLFEERGESAKTADRPQLQEMMTFGMVNRNNIDALIIYRINRLSRKTMDYGAIKAYFLKLGINVISVTEPIDNTPAGKFMETVIAATGELDNDVRAQQSRNGMVDAVKDGRWVWKAPYGYENTRVDGKKNIAPVSGSLPQIIREAWVMVDAGFSLAEVRIQLYPKGLEHNGKIVPFQTISKMFRKTVYKGVIDKFNLNIVSESIVPIVEPELWDRVLARLEGKNNKPAVYTKLRSDFPLRGTLYCQYGHRMTASSPRGNGGVYPKYHCPTCRKKGTSYDRDDTEKRFVEYASGIQYSPPLHDALSTAIELALGQRRKSSSGKVKQLKSRLAELEDMEMQIGEKNLKGIYSDVYTQKLLRKNAKDVSEIIEQLGEIKTYSTEHEDVIQFGLSALSNVGSVWLQVKDVYVKDRFQKWLFPAGLEFDGEKFGTTVLPLCLSIKNDLSEEKSLLVTPRRVELLLPG
jgi:site-specific DNA recombinase